MSKKVIVTGASGFLGSKLCDALAQQHIEVTGLNTAAGDITDKDYFHQPGCDDCVHVFHLAARTFVPDSWTDPRAFITTNTLGTVNVLEFCRARKIPLTFVSAFVYGNVPNPIHEETVARPNNPYALSKKLAEDVCLFYTQHYDLPVTVVRPFNIYGPGQPSHFLIPSIITQALQNGSVTVGDVTPKRDYVYIDDVTGLLTKMVGKTATGIFNAGTGRSYSVLEVIGLVEKILGKKIAIESSKTQRKNEIMDTVAAIDKARQELNWTPQWDLEKGLAATIKAIGENLNR